MSNIEHRDYTITTAHPGGSPRWQALIYHTASKFEMMVLGRKPTFDTEAEAVEWARRKIDARQ
jgi:hypothetical protein